MAVDVKVQRPAAAAATIAVDATVATLTAGVDYTAPASAASAFILLADTHRWGIPSASTVARSATACIANPDNILTSINLERNSVSATVTVAGRCEILEYIGAAAGANEFIVRQVGVLSGTGTALNGTAVTGVVDDNDVVVFITGQRSSENLSGTLAWADAMFTSSWDVPNQRAVLTRVTGTGNNSVSYAVVEFTGSNWLVQRVVDHAFAAVGADETEVIASVGAAANAFVHSQMRMTREATTNHSSGGWYCYVSDATHVTYRLGDNGELHGQTVAAWVISNPDMTVARYPDSIATGGNETSAITAVSALEDVSIMEMGARLNYANANYLSYGALAGTLDDTTTAHVYRQSISATTTYRFAAVTWPEGAAGNIPLFARLSPTLDGAAVPVGDGAVRQRSLRFEAAEYTTPFYLKFDGASVAQVRVDSLPATVCYTFGTVAVSSTA